MALNTSVNWKAERASVLTFEHFDNTAGRWTIIEMDFGRKLGSKTRDLHCDRILSEHVAAGFEGVYMYGDNHAKSVREIH